MLKFIKNLLSDSKDVKQKESADQSDVAESSTKGNTVKPVAPAPESLHQDLTKMEQALLELENYARSLDKRYYRTPIEGEPHYDFYVAMVKGTPNERKEVAIMSIYKWVKQQKGGTFISSNNRSAYNILQVYQEMIEALIKKQLPFTDQEYTELLTALSNNPFKVGDYYRRKVIKKIIRQVERYSKKNSLSESLKQVLASLPSNKVMNDYREKERAKFALRIKNLLIKDELESGQRMPVYFEKGDRFGDSMNTWLNGQSKEHRNDWFGFLELCQKAKAGKPTLKFLKAVQEQFEQHPMVKEELMGWLNVLTNEKEQIKALGNDHGMWRGSYKMFHGTNEIMIKGMIWSGSLISSVEMIEVLHKLALLFYTKVRHIGQVAPVLGNASCYALSRMDNVIAIGYLSGLKTRVNQVSTRKLIDRFVLEAATRKGLSKGDLEDAGVPDFGLKEGRCQFEVGDYLAEIELPPTGKPMLTWSKIGGKALKSTPKAAKEKHPELVKKIQGTYKAVGKILSAQKLRFDRFYLENRSWKLARFEEVLLHHGLLGSFVKRLIWYFDTPQQSGIAIWRAGHWVDVNGTALDWLSPETRIRLWHPATVDAAVTMAWRDALEEWQIVQPFKQAHREIYLLTEAELNTRTYSNRMAAHIIRQHQMSSLAKGRGWKHTVVGGWDHGGNVASLDLPDLGLRADFWLEDLDGDQNYADSGVYMHIGTDQVRFYKKGEQEPLPLVDIPPILFSEVMRDVDLFVGVASVGNDPTWNDRGDDRMRTYWRSYSFGDLSASASTRKAVLDKLLPKLKIAKVAELQDKFLVVKGKVRTYKIHIGSTNILMAPNDEYLCIVEKRGNKKPTNVFLPFEGDHGLAVLLSKAFLLAADDKIKDQTILSQIHRNRS